MVRVGIGQYQISCSYDNLPPAFDGYVKRAALTDQLDLSAPEGKVCFVAVARDGEDWPRIVVALRYKPADGIFFPGVLVVPETNRLFIGAGARLLCYDLDQSTRLWEDSAECGFWSWRHDASEVFMSAELEFAVFDANGNKLWTRFVEPPWSFKLGNDFVALNVMGTETRLNRRTGEVST